MKKEAILIKYAGDRHLAAFKAIQRLKSMIEDFKFSYVEFATDMGMEQHPTKELIIAVSTTGRAVIERQIDAFANSKGKVLKVHYLEFGYKKLNDLDKHINNLHIWHNSPRFREIIPGELSSLVTFQWEDDELIVDENFFNAIRPQFETWATTPAEKELYNKYLALIDSYNAFYQLAIDQNVVVPDNFASLTGTQCQIRVESVKPAAWFFPTRLKSWRPS